ncbi:lipoate--protein ligase family protein [Nakamurella endophytica]|uniref:BPL/LPL catalytic domain-containing protein n=1 Tax=Nakamurella endophytica TaxID=1748367 RepID=A0A917WHE8_9ACTN|nr:lipoate--protein ligase family protein [Nakamurella endophytica]GGM05172.1 hypothetical protein GCM10011594_26760 [Nakamurella endophytica]
MTTPAPTVPSAPPVLSVPDAVRTLVGAHRRLAVATGPAGADAAAHAGLGPALLRWVADARDGAWLRLYSPPPTAAFSALDLLSPHRDASLAAARQAGWTPVRRAPGGRMAAYHRGALCLDLVVADRPGDPDPWQRLAALGHLLVAVLRSAGVDARLGAVPDEYCPGRYSVNAGGTTKLAGTAARRTSAATLVSGVLVVQDPAPVREVVTAVYRRLDMPLDPSTVGAVADHRPGLDVAEVRRLLVDAVASGVTVTEAALPALTPAAVDPGPGAPPAPTGTG